MSDAFTALIEGANAEGRERTAWFVPGRIEVLGKHTDYAGGRSLLAAPDRGHTVRAQRRADGIITVRSQDAEGEIRIDLDHPEDRQDAVPGHWGGYVHTAVERLAANFPGRLVGADLQVSSTLPLASGMSSSSALIVAVALALIDLSGIAADPAFTGEITSVEQLGEYLGAVENGQSFGTLAGHRGVGTFGGSEDHTGMLCGQEGALVQYSFCPVRHERTVPLRDDLAFVIAVSGVEAVKTGAARDAYNRVSLAVSEILQRWREATGREDATLVEAVATGPQGIARLKELAADDAYLSGRLAQFLCESERLVPAAAVALEEGDLEEFGHLVDESQCGAEKGLLNQVEQTVALQRQARALGAHAASAFGAGFGGSVWALVGADDAEGFATRWLEGYRAEFPDLPLSSTFVCRPGTAAHRVGYASMNA